MKNPLNKRILRELRKEWKKYLVLFAMLALTIAMVSGVFVANDSMITASEEAYDKYNIEDGHFDLKNEASDKLLSSFEKENIKVYKQYFAEFAEDIDLDGEKDAKIRIFKTRTDINRADLLKGEYPQNDNEIVIDRMHADNNKIKVGSKIRLGDREFVVSGLAAFSDYSCLYEKSTDMIFDALTFNVGVVTDECFDKLEGNVKYQYAYNLDKRPKENEKSRISEELIKKIAMLSFADNNEVLEFVPEYANQAIHFATDDMGSDKNLSEIILLLLVIVLAFISAITQNNTIIEEAAVIGTLRSSGYTKGELLRHYITCPVLVTLLAAFAGNLLGYTVFKDIIVKMYYNSYSLPSYKTIWNTDAFVKTTLFPMLLMLVINILVVSRKLRLSPLKFLRRDLSTSKRKKAMRLPRWKFMSRFRLRILFQNAGGYLTLFFGILFVMILMAFVVGMPATLKHYQKNAKDYLVADYQYILKESKDINGNEITTEEESAEKFSTATLKSVDGAHIGENVSVYGYVEGSAFIKPDGKTSGKEVYVSDSYAEKFSLKKGRKIRLKEQFTDKEYEFEIAGIYEMPGVIAVVMNNEQFNEVFGLEKDSFTGYLSKNEIKDIDERNILTVVTVDDILKMANQLDHSMGNYMDYFSVIVVIIAMMIIYLLTKIIIEHNKVSISMVKVLGYTNKEIDSLYVRLTTIVAFVSCLLAVFLSINFIHMLWYAYLKRMNGWMPFTIGVKEYIKCFVAIMGAYLLVSFADMQRIKKVPLADALKNVE